MNLIDQKTGFDALSPEFQAAYMDQWSAFGMDAAVAWVGC